MRVSEVKLKRESDRELFFAHYPLGGVVFALLGAGFGYLPVYLGADSWTRWIFGIMGALFAIIGILGAFWRYEFRLDLISRTYTRRRGMWPAPQTHKGSLNDLTAVILTQEWSRSRSARGHTSDHPWWKLSLEFTGWDKPVSIEAVGSEQHGHERLEYYAKKLKVPAIDRTAEKEIARNWNELDQPLAAQKADRASQAGAVGIGDPRFPPPGSAIVSAEDTSGLRILLPAIGFNAALVLFTLFGAVFATFGGFFLLVKSGLFMELTGKTIAVTESSPGATWIIAPIFLLIGVVIILLGVVGSYGTEEIAERGDWLIYRFLFLGRALRSRDILKKDVEEIDLRSDISARHRSRRGIAISKTTIETTSRSRASVDNEIMIRSDNQVIRFGKHLAEADKQWLASALNRLCRGAS